jgi:hypothetical protein
MSTKTIARIDATTEAPVTVADGLLAMIERLAVNPQVDIARVERLIEMKERVIAHQARAEYFAAFSVMQGEIPAIRQRGRGDKNAHYATNEDIQAVIRPILSRHGFMLSFRTEFLENKVKVIGVLAHRAGHLETAEFVSAADMSGSKNAIQALGSTQSYGQRYTTKALLNITGTDDTSDDDGAATAGPPDPAGFDDWWLDLQAVAESGRDALRKTWDVSPLAFRKHLTSTKSAAWEALKRSVK